MITSYSSSGILTSEWNPFKQPEARKQRIQLMQEQEQKESQEIESLNKKYRELYGKLFINPGYANKNNDNIISFEEQVDAWSRMGLIKMPVFEGIQLPRPSLNDLEKAIKSYETELKVDPRGLN